MNHIYKVVFCKTTGTFVAVAEYARAHGKNSIGTVGSVSETVSGVADSAMGTGKYLMFSVISSAMLLMSGNVLAATGTTTSGGTAVTPPATGTNACYYEVSSGAVVCGDVNTTTTATNGSNTVALGTGSNTLNTNDIAIGNGAGKNFKDQGTSFGGTGNANFYSNGILQTITAGPSFATNTNVSIGAGAGTNSTGQRNVAIGNNASTQYFGEDSVTMGTNANNVAVNGLANGAATTNVVRARRTVAIGVNAMTYGEDSIALGNAAKTVGIDSIAIGRNAKAIVTYPSTSTNTEQGAIAIGNAAIAPHNQDISIGQGAGNSIPQNYTGTQPLAQNINIGQGSGDGSFTNDNVVVGNSSGRNVGQASLRQQDNAVVGSGSGNNVIGDTNTVLGWQSGNNVNSNSNVAIGPRVGSNVSGPNNVAMVITAGNFVKGDSNISLGAASGNYVGVNDNATSLNPITNTWNGTSVAVTPNGTSDNNIAAGRSAGSYVSGNSNYAFGINAGRYVNYDPTTKALTGNTSSTTTGVSRQGNMAFGENAGSYINGGNNITLGANAGKGTAATVLTRDNSLNFGTAAMAYSDNSIAMGTNSVAGVINTKSVTNGIAIGNASKAIGNQAIAIGTGNIVNGANSGTLGDPTINNGVASYTVGNDNAVGSTTTGGFVLGNNNQTGATATYDPSTGKLDLASGITDGTSATNSAAVGNRNAITSQSTYVLGSGINTSGPATNLQLLNGTVANSVYLGDDSSATAGAAATPGSLRNRLKDSTTVGTTTTAGSTGTVTNATVNGVTYGTFAGQTAVGAITVGASGAERRIQNVAAGEISATSTDAINGSQLYSVAKGTIDQLPVVYTDATGNKVTKSPNGNFYPAGTPLDAAGNPTNGAAPVANVIASMNSPTGSTTTVTKLTNVAPATLSPTSTDAVNGSQLYSTNQNVANNTTAINNINSQVNNTYFHTNTPSSTTSAANDTTTNLGSITDSAGATGRDSIAAGENANANGRASVAVGYGTKATQDYAIAHGYGAQSTGLASTSIGAFSSATQLGAIATGLSSSATAENAIAIGSNSNASIADSVALGSNSVTRAVTPTSSGAVNGVTYGTFSGNAPTSAVSFGDVGTERQLQNVAAGQISATSTDAINGSQLYATQNVIGNVANSTATILGGNAAVNPTTGAITMTNVGGTGANNVNDAIKNARTTVTSSNSSISVSDTNNGTGNLAYDLKVNTDGITTTTNASGQVTAVTAPITSTGGVASVTAPANPNSLATAGDVVNAVNATGFNITSVANGGTVTGSTNEFINSGETVKLQAGNGVAIAQSGNDFTFSVNSQNIANGAQLPVVYTQADGTKVVKDPVSGNFYVANADGTPNLAQQVQPTDIIASMQNADGTTSTQTKLTNVAPATLSPTSTDAVNGSQLYATNQNVAANTTAITTNTTNIAKGINFGGTTGSNNYQLGDTINVKGDSNITSTTVNGGAQLGLANNITVGTTNPITISGDNGTVSGLTNTSFDPNTTYTGGQAATQEQVKQAYTNARTTVKSTDGSISVVDTNNGTGNLAYDIKVNNQAITNGAQLPVVYTDNAGNKVYLVNGAFNTAPDGSGTNVPNTNVIASMQNPDGTVSTQTKLTNVAPATLSPNSTDAVNGSQLYATNQNVAANTTAINANTTNIANNTAAINKGTVYAGDTTTGATNAFTRQLGDQTNIVGGAKGTLTDNNIGVVSNGTDTLTVKLAKDINLGTDGSVTTGNTVVNNTGVTINNTDPTKTVSLTSGGLNNGGNVISNVGAGVKADDAVNVSQLQAAQAASTTKVAAGTGTTVTNTPNTDGSTTYTVSAKTDGTTITTNGAGALTAVTSPITTNANGSVNTPAAPNALATAGDVANAINNSGFNLTAQGANSSVVKPGSTVDMKNTDGNIVVSKNATDNTVNYDLAKNVKVDSVGINNSNVSLGNTGLNNGGNTISNLGSGGNVTTNAANIGDVQNARTTLQSSDNSISVVNTAAAGSPNFAYDIKVNNQGITNGSQLPVVYTNTNGDKVYKVGDNFYTNPQGTGTPVDTGSVIASMQNAAGSTTSPTKLTNIAPATLSPTSTDAVNGSQLYATNQQVANNTAAIGKGINFGGTTGSNNYQLGDTMNVKGDSNISSTTVAGGVQLALARDINVNSVTAGNTVLSTTGLNNGGNTITNVAAGVNATDAVNVSQLNNVKSVIGIADGQTTPNIKVYNVADRDTKNNVTVVDAINHMNNEGIQYFHTNGADTNAIRNEGATHDASAEAARSTAIGVKATVGKDASDGIAIGTGATVAEKAANAVALGAGSVAKQTPAQLQATPAYTPRGTRYDAIAGTGQDVAGEVSVGDTGATRRLTNLAAGALPTDAVNVSQLAAVDDKVNRLGYKLGDVEDNANAGISGAMAMAALPQAYLPGKSMLAGGMATYNGEGAVAIGVSKLSDNGRWVIKVNGTADTRGNAGAAVGAGFHW